MAGRHEGESPRGKLTSQTQKEGFLKYTANTARDAVRLYFEPIFWLRNRFKQAKREKIDLSKPGHEDK